VGRSEAPRALLDARMGGVPPTSLPLTSPILVGLAYWSHEAPAASATREQDEQSVFKLRAAIER
jgi:hypothetical protein